MQITMFSWGLQLRIRCLNGFYQFYDFTPTQISRFASLYELPIVPRENYHTFQALQNAPDFCLGGGTYLGAKCEVSYSGSPWEIMLANNLVYDFTKDKVVPFNSITLRADILNAGFYFVSDGLLLAGSIDQKQKKVRSYSGFYDFNTGSFRYVEVDRV